MRSAVLGFVLLYAADAYAQQSLFNVPSTQETIPGKLFGQVQVTGTEHGGEVNTTLELGIFPWLELGANIMRVQMYRLHNQPGTDASTPSLLLNANVYFDPLEWLAFEVGMQGGGGFRPSTTHVEAVIFGWASARFDAPGRFGSYVIGAYSGTRGALGQGLPFGGMLGAEIPIIEDRLHFQADWMIGVNAISVAVLGAVAYIGHSFQISAGVQVPSPGSGNQYGGVLELTYVPVPDDGDIGHPANRPQKPNS